MSSTIIDCTVCGNFKNTESFTTNWQLLHHVCDNCYSKPTWFRVESESSRATCDMCHCRVQKYGSYMTDGDLVVDAHCINYAAEQARNSLVGPYDSWHWAKAQVNELAQ